MSILYIAFWCLVVSSLEPTYREGQQLKLEVHDLDSRKTHIRYDYSYVKTCPLDSNLGLQKNQLPHKIEVLTNAKCVKACTVNVSQDDIQKYQWLIDHSYEMFISLSPETPALYLNTEPDSDKLVSYDLGFPLGWRHDVDKTSVRVNNQIKLVFHFRRNQSSIEVLNLIVEDQNCAEPDVFLDNQVKNISYFYTVEWVQTKEKIQPTPDVSEAERISWIFFSFVVSIIYSLIISSILYRNLMRDLRNCARQILGTTVHEFMEIEQERQRGWKQHQREVFRPPQRRFILSVLFGAGCQMIIVVVGTLLLMASKNFRYFEFQDEQIMWWLQIFFIVSTFFGGYMAARLYKMWLGTNWLNLSLATSSLLPMTFTTSLYIQNSMRILQDSLSYSLFEMFYLPMLWFIIAIPLCIIGSYVGFKRKALSNPFSVHAVENRKGNNFSVKKQLKIGVLSSLIPYLSFAAEFRVLLDSFWISNPYEMYQLLFISIILLILSSSLASIYTTYKSLNEGNPKWWGIPFVISGGLAICFFLSQTVYLIFYMNITRLSSIIIYFCWSFMSIWTVFLFCGATTFLLTALAVRKIYQMIKIQ